MEEKAYYLLLRGKRLLAEGNPFQAALVLEKACESAPGKGSILEVLGRAYFACRRYEESAGGFEEALLVDPTNDYAHFCLGLCYARMKRRADAERHFKMAWFLKPSEEYRVRAASCGVAEAANGNPPLEGA